MNRSLAMRNLLLVLLLAPSVLGAQTFNRLYGKAFPDEEISGGSVERNGTIYTLSRDRHYNTNPTSYLTFQVADAQGDTLFTRSIEDAEHPFAVGSFKSSRTSTDFFNCGLKQNSVVLPYTTSYLVRHNDQGDTLWYHEYTNSDQNYEFLTLWSLAIGQDDGLTALGWTVHDTVWPYDDGPSSIYLMKTDAQGNRLWDKTYPPDYKQPQDLVGLPDGGYLVVGYTQVGTWLQVDSLIGWIIRTDGVGNELWHHELPASKGITFIRALSDGNYLIGGAFSDTCCGLKSAGFISKIDEEGTVQWDRTFYRPDTLGTFNDGVELADGSLAICGFDYDTPSGSEGGWVVKTDGAGYLQWDRMMDKTTNYDAFSRITACTDGGILMTGQAQRDQLSDVWLVKLDSLGCDADGCPPEYHTGITEHPVSSSAVENGGEAIAQPNPFGNCTTITCPLPQGAHDVQLTITDLQGRVLETRRVTGESRRISGSSVQLKEQVAAGDKADGIYLCRITAAGVLVGSVRLVVQR